MPSKIAKELNVPLSLQKVEYLLSIDDLKQLSAWLQENTGIRGISVIGRSNVGKSSLINSLFGQNLARISKTPGKTRKINIFRFSLQELKNVNNEENAFYLFDLPGYGFAQVSKEMTQNWNDLMFLFYQHLSPLVLHLLLQDARHMHHEADTVFMKFLSPIYLQKFLVLNKFDKLKTQKERASLKKEMQQIFKYYKNVLQIHTVSAEYGTNMGPLVASIKGYLLQGKI